MSKAEVQPLISLVLCGSKITDLLLWCHGVPCLLLSIILPHVITFDEDNKDDVPSQYSKQDLVATSVQRFIIVLVNLYSSDT
jgi:hypothetical protein